MRNAAIALLLFGSTTFLTAATFEARSKHHAIAIDVHDNVYDVVVTDLDTNQILLTEHPTTQIASPVNVSKDVGDLHISVNLSPKPGALMSLLEIEQGDLLVDSISTTWSTAPRHAHLHAPGALRVGGQVKAPIVIHRVEPVYSEEARRGRVSGIVVVEVLIDKNGVVKDTMIIKPLPFGLDQAAVDAVKQWTFQPATLNGQPVDVIFNLVVNFKLDSPPPSSR